MYAGFSSQASAASAGAPDRPGPHPLTKASPATMARKRAASSPEPSGPRHRSGNDVLGLHRARGSDRQHSGSMDERGDRCGVRKPSRTQPGHRMNGPPDAGVQPSAAASCASRVSRDSIRPGQTGLLPGSRRSNYQPVVGRQSFSRPAPRAGVRKTAVYQHERRSFSRLQKWRGARPSPIALRPRQRADAFRALGGQFVYEADLPLCNRPKPRCARQLVLRHDPAWTQLHEGHRTAPNHRPPDDRRFGHRRMGCERRFDLGRIDVFAARMIRSLRRSRTYRKPSSSDSRRRRYAPPPRRAGRSRRL